MAAPLDLNFIQDPEATDIGGFFIGDDPAGRAVLPRAELLERLSALMRACEGCERVAVTGVDRLDQPDTEGCTWSMSIVLEPNGVPAEVYGLAYASVIALARASWNLE